MSAQPQFDPNEYRQNQQGHLVPIGRVKDIDLQRDDLVRAIIDTALGVQHILREFKYQTMEEIAAFMDLSAEQYGTKLGGNKGNVSLTSYDGRYKIQRSIQDNIQFDERLQIAKQLVDECIHDWSDGAREEIVLLVNDAFQVDKEGNVSISRVLGLKRLDIKNAKWQQAMQAINDSMQTVASSTYLRLYERDEKTSKYKQIPLDIAAL